MLRARLAVMEHRGLLQKYAVAELLPVLVISASLVLQVLLIIAGFTALVMVTVALMVLMNLVMRFVVVAGVVPEMIIGMMKHLMMEHQTHVQLLIVILISVQKVLNLWPHHVLMVQMVMLRKYVAVESLHHRL